ncbi:hypothetical protein J7K43_06455 [Candidatus Calescamantes bacterium]|nr:hypothetical protein [Candidatus Calescamantes bacterium]
MKISRPVAFALFIAKNEVEFDAPDKKPVRIFVVSMFHINSSLH